MKVQMIYKENTNSEKDTLEAFTKNENIANLFTDIYRNLYIDTVDMYNEEYEKLVEENGGKEIISFKSKHGIGMVIVRKCDELELIMCGCKLYDSVK